MFLIKQLSDANLQFTVDNLHTVKKKKKKKLIYSKGINFRWD